MRGGAAGPGRLLGPTVLLAAATLAVLAVRLARGDNGADRAVSPPPATSTAGLAAGSGRGQPAPPPPPRAPARTYAIRSGDTLGAVAERYGTTVEALLAANPGIEPSALRVGRRIRLP